MFERELRRFRDCMRREDYEATRHGWREIRADGLSVLDVESCILEGSIVERQRDRRTWEWKYVIEGPALDGGEIAIVVKRLASGRMLILTVFRI